MDKIGSQVKKERYNMHNSPSQSREKMITKHHPPPSLAEESTQGERADSGKPRKRKASPSTNRIPTCLLIMLLHALR